MSHGRGSGNICWCKKCARAAPTSGPSSRTFTLIIVLISVCYHHFLMSVIMTVFGIVFLHIMMIIIYW